MIKTIGIMYHLDAPELVNRYREIALEEGFHELIFFTPKDVNLLKKQITAYLFRNQRWIRTITPFPTIWYDLGYYSSEDTLKVRKIKQHPDIQLLGGFIGNKATIQKHLEKSPELKNYLIPTARVNEVSLRSMIKKYKSIMIKPMNGMGGEGIIRLIYNKNQFQVQQNQQLLQVHSTKDMKKILKNLDLQKQFIIQRWIDIRDQENQVYDIRVLMQKNAHFKWELTGMAIRRGAKGSITSNLKGGGTVHEVRHYLESLYGAPNAETILGKIKKIAHYIPNYLESSYKKNLFELGLDLAIDRNRNIWIIEVNNKPGKTIFERLQNSEADDRSIRLPIQYALSFVNRTQKIRR